MIMTRRSAEAMRDGAAYPHVANPASDVHGISLGDARPGHARTN
jgi:hypothetical protein